MRNAAVLELLQDELQGRDTLDVGLADHDGGVAGGERLGAFVLKLDGAWAVDEGEMVVEEFGVGDVERHAHAVGTSFRRCVADGRAALDAAGTDHAPVRARMASRRVVLPERYGPISAMQRELRAGACPGFGLAECPMVSSFPLSGLCFRTSATRRSSMRVSRSPAPLEGARQQ